MTRIEDPKTGYIAIATAQFSQSGYHGTSLAAVAHTAGVTKQALLHFFGTKQKLYAAVLEALATRLTKAVTAEECDDPVAHLRSYFQRFHQTAQDDPDDIRLVVRALLDADEAARRWPMKSYLDQLLALIARTPNGVGMTQAERLAWLSEMIGMLQYLSISHTAVSGMYGRGTAGAVHDAFEASLDAMLGRLSPLQ